MSLPSFLPSSKAWGHSMKSFVFVWSQIHLGMLHYHFIKGERRISMHASLRSNLKHWHPYYWVCWNGCCSEATQHNSAALGTPPFPTKSRTPLPSCQDTRSMPTAGVGKCSGRFCFPQWCTSRSMTESEMRYTQIGKEALDNTWTCEHFSDYILARQSASTPTSSLLFHRWIPNA